MGFFNMLNNKSILVTGGTGSFGKNFIKTILKKYPNFKRIVIYSRDELKQFEMSNMEAFKNNDRLRFFIGDVRDKKRLSMALRDIDVVVHAAALKQVPACEYNPFEAVKTNVIGAENVIEASIERGVKKVVALSTDKACSPINLYGATKLCSDKLFIAGNAYVGDGKTKFSVVRYGNVAGSRGSVIPYFQNLIKNGAKEIPITDEKMTRFWLKLEEAVEMVFSAIDMMKGGELFVKKIPSIKITDLAKAIAPNLPIKNVGIRPGEKIHEMMITKEDARSTIELDDFYIIKPQLSWWDEQYKYDGEKPIVGDFEYHSGNNKKWLSVEQIQELIKEL
jgi:UDP-N-acetylglucosamine 4,6-dehydratase (inverting)